MFAQNSEQARTAHSVHAIGLLLGALTLETQALRHSQEAGNRIASARLELELERAAFDKKNIPLGLG